ncbi:hypothetical protein [Massilia sp. WF1]|uniref:hypothetical protein n=1 Tax=Massilia sp. WF1 TaxID=1406431 RepID=UPI0018D26F74|nr:hypothetical protein [Massilia sp. WF1]
MLEDRIDQMATVKKVFDDGEWLTAEEINKLQIRPPRKKSFPASAWKRHGGSSVSCIMEKNISSLSIRPDVSTFAGRQEYPEGVWRMRGYLVNRNVVPLSKWLDHERNR